MSKRKRILTDEEVEKIKKAKEELNQYKEDIKYIEEKLNDTEEVKSKVERITTTISFNKTNNTNSNNDKFSNAINRLEELKIDCTKKMQQLLIKKFMIDDKIELLEQPYKNILFFRYTRAKSWRDIAEELGYTESYIYDLHGEALYLYSKL